MPQAAPKPCTHPGCGALVRDGTSRCPKHPRENKYATRRDGSRHERGYGKVWDRLRKAVLLRDKGLCQPCLARDDVTSGNEVDHIIPKSQGGTDEETNLQVICKACHQVKTQREARWGRGG